MKLFWNNPQKRIEKLQNARKYDELLKFCSSILEKDPHNLDALKVKIFSLQKLKRNKDASSYCNKVIEMYPYDSDIIDCIVKMSKNNCFPVYLRLKLSTKKVQASNDSTLS